MSSQLGVAEEAHCQLLIGVPRWVVGLSRIDAFLEVPMMTSHESFDREGHLEGLCGMLGHLKKCYDAKLAFDLCGPLVDLRGFERKDWSSSEFGHLLSEKRESYPNAPRPRGIFFVNVRKVHADRTSDLFSRRSRIGVIVCLNSSPVHWHSKKQSSEESRTFGSEFIAMKKLCECFRGLRHKL